MSLFQRLNDIKKRPAPQSPETGARSVLLPGGREISTGFGKCFLLEDCREGAFPFPGGDTSSLLANLKLIRGVGPVYEEKLRDQGLARICDLVDHPRWGMCARQVMDLIEKRRIRELQLLGARDREWLPYFTPEDVVFLDIETTGLWASQPLFLIGLLYYRGGKLFTSQFFARHYREEKAVLAAADEALKKFKIIVSYNGKRFDVPYICGRSVEHRLFYSYPHHQVDMLYHARRRFSGMLPDCRLVTLEEHILNFRREGDIPGHLIPETYHRFVQRQDAGMIGPVIEHNRLDLLAMARLFSIVGDDSPGEADNCRAFTL
ncbi:MAG: ribonuclease H-like domain-containing protein [Bacillota bacterium]